VVGDTQFGQRGFGVVAGAAYPSRHSPASSGHGVAADLDVDAPDAGPDGDDAAGSSGTETRGFATATRRP